LVEAELTLLLVGLQPLVVVANLLKLEQDFPETLAILKQAALDLVSYPSPITQANLEWLTESQLLILLETHEASLDRYHFL